MEVWDQVSPLLYCSTVLLSRRSRPARRVGSVSPWRRAVGCRCLPHFPGLTLRLAHGASARRSAPTPRKRDACAIIFALKARVVIAQRSKPWESAAPQFPDPDGVASGSWRGQGRPKRLTRSHEATKGDKETKIAHAIHLRQAYGGQAARRREKDANACKTTPTTA